MSDRNMTITIDLDDRAWFDAIPVDGIGVHVVEGRQPRIEVRPFGRRQGRSIYVDDRFVSDHYTQDSLAAAHANIVRATVASPPSEWVALSEQKCETCGGRGWTADLPEHPGPRGMEVSAPLLKCPNCIKGRSIVRVTAPCPCKQCVYPSSPSCATGRVSIGSVTVEAVVPIRRMEGDRGNPLPAVLVGIDQHLGHSWGAFYWTEDAQVPVDLGSNPEQYVGKFGVIVRRVS